MAITPYLFFDGKTEEAIEFYKKAIGAKVEMLMRFKDAPPGEGGFIHNWIQLLDEARDVVVDRYGDQRDRDVERAMEQEGVKVSLTNLRSFPCVRRRPAGT